VDTVTRTERFVQALTACQSRLFAFILTLVPNEEAARDILQETNLVIWRKSDEFQDGTNFGSWACRIAHYQVLAYWRDAGRDRHVFNEEFFRDFVTDSLSATEDIDSKASALRQCLAQLSPPQQELLRQRYSPGSSVESLAKSLRILPSAVSNRLYRLRQVLRNCVRRKLNTEGA
jgi:RNA polymerase sigma-70 factor (ECF subfamily)